MSIAKNLPRLRKEKGLSQVALAKKAGVSQQLISRLESGVDLTSKKLPELARAIGVQISEIDENYHASDATQQDPDDRLRAALLAFGIDSDRLELAVGAVKVLLRPREEPPSQDEDRDQSQSASPRHVKAPSE